MKVLQIRTVEVCLDGTVIREIRIDRTITREFIGHLGDTGLLEYFPAFARPFFRITRAGAYVIKGVEGEETFRVVYLSDYETQEELLRKHIESLPGSEISEIGP
ncbi:MAG: hypothetical protein LUQ25_07070 [Methanoregulaceae archaeon]|nr:hypothetical protein [Methanoregulaceae archaeon]